MQALLPFLATPLECPGELACRLGCRENPMGHINNFENFWLRQVTKSLNFNIVCLFAFCFCVWSFLHFLLLLLLLLLLLFFITYQLFLKRFSLSPILVLQWNLNIKTRYITKSLIGITSNFVDSSNSKIYGKVPRYNETSCQQANFASPLVLCHEKLPL